MAVETTFTDIAIDELLELTAKKKEDGYRFVQVLSRMADPGIDVIYTFQKNACIENYAIRGYDPETQTIPSVTGYYLVAFPFENEAHDLFGVRITDIAIDFAGKFYDVSVEKPMTVISPAQKAAREKKAKLEAAKAAKAAKEAKEAEESKEDAAASEQADEKPPQDDPMAAIEAKRAAMEEKLAAMDPEKAAKVRAGFEAKIAKEIAAIEAAKAEATAKAQEAANDQAADAVGSDEPTIEQRRAELEAKLEGMDPEKAAKVRAGFEAKLEREAKAAREAAQKGGE